MSPRLRYCLLSLALALGVLYLQVSIPTSVRAEVGDPFDPFDPWFEEGAEDKQEEDKTALELLTEASQLFTDERPLDARSKLLRALRKDPSQYRTHMMLAGYYIQHVGHFRLALRYTLQALELFKEKHGSPPYTDYIAQAEHKQILYLITQSRLNLDNYQGALETLDQFNGYGYFEEWYPGTRAWVLMKLGDLDEAIKVARIGILSGAEGGRALNMLGILLSMHGEREQALQVFKEAIEHEFSLGSEGEPATPLNNRGEVFKELYDDDRAETSWLKATSLPSGCEHILPSLNLTLLYVDQLNFKGAKRAIDSFLSCSAQFPLRNGEEHKAFVEFARGRIAMHTGKMDQAIKHLEAALEQRQWFGKIGTDSKDLRTGVLISLAQALTFKTNQMRFHQFRDLRERIIWLKQSLEYKFLSWWYLRRARQILSEDLRGFEDLEIRHTDSMLEYSTLGEAMGGFPEPIIRQRLSQQRKQDSRQGSRPYYEMYLAETLLANGREEDAFELLQKVVREARPQFDLSLGIQARTRLLEYLEPNGAEYRSLATQIFREKRAQLRNYGLRLPVGFETGRGEPGIVSKLSNSAFMITNASDAPFHVRYEFSAGEHIFSFEAGTSGIGSIKVRGNDIDEVINRFTDEVFTQDLGDSGG